jgi:hypothetical protein
MKSAAKFLKYPTPDDVHYGSAVAWYYYRSHAAAQAAAELAVHNAEVRRKRSKRGHSFGISVPGSIHRTKHYSLGEVYEVCIP